MEVQSKQKFQDNWLAKALIYYQIIDEGLYEELAQRFPDESYFFDVLIKNEYLKPEDIAVFIENALKIPTINLDKVSIDPKLIKQIPEAVCRKNLIIPFAIDKKQIRIASFNPSNLNAENEIEYLTGRYVKTYFAYKDQINQKINEYYSPEKIIDNLVGKEKSGSKVKIAGDDKQEGSSSVVRLVNQILSDAITEEASDVHIEPKEDGVSVRFRIDGVLRSKLELPRSIHSTLMSRIKIISNLNIAETRKPQDGKAKIIVDDVDIDLRISILPTSYGEKGVIRILDRRNAAVSFEKMGIRGENRKLLEQCFAFTQGMVLVTGPTGSGKSTTLYSAINRIRSATNNILTIEDPIEYMIEDINQVQVNEKAGISFATALRSFLRQDPDVILVGEIRDKETAEIAIQAALTGHLVLSTLHTNDTFTTITRLQDIGVDKTKITESLEAIIAQRLVRRLCNHCKLKVNKDDIDGKLNSLIRQLGFTPQVYEAKGCKECGFAGYKGRIGVYEILLLDDKLRDLINSDGSIREIRRTAREQGFHNLFEDGLTLIAEGITDYKEVIRVIHPGSQKDDLPVNKTEEEPKNEETKKDYTQASLISQEVRDEYTKKKEMPLPLYKRPDTTKLNKDILVVEDNRATRMIIKKMIEKKTSWTVREAEDGIKALVQVVEKAPDLIVLDIMMPSMDGFEFLQHLRAEPSTERLPVLVLTSLKTTENEIKGLQFGADDFLTKPINLDLLITHIKRLLDRADAPDFSKVIYAEQGESTKESENAGKPASKNNDDRDSRLKLI